jgi:hypothetical protein
VLNVIFNTNPEVELSNNGQNSNITAITLDDSTLVYSTPEGKDIYTEALAYSVAPPELFDWDNYITLLYEDIVYKLESAKTEVWMRKLYEDVMAYGG